MDQIIANIDNIVLTFVQGSFGGLTGTVQTLWRMMFIVFIAVYGYKIIISGKFSASDLVMNCVKIIVLLVLATQWSAFFLFVYRMVTDLPSDIAGQIMQAASAAFGNAAVASDPITASNALEQFYDRSVRVAAQLLEGAGWHQTGLYFYALITWLCALGFTAYATMLIVLSKLAVAVLLAVGPIFILLLIFTDTRKLFEGWLRALLNYAIIPVFVYTLLAILLALAEAPLRYMEQHNGVYDQFFTSVGPFLLICSISIMLLAQIMNMAASITGGIALSTMGGGVMAITGLRYLGESLALGALPGKNPAPDKNPDPDKNKNEQNALKQSLQKNREATS
ncbi:MAG: type IV secretion system protein [Pseudomonadota bacterium]